MGEARGSIGFFATYRPPVPLDLYSCPIPTNLISDEVLLTDGRCYNYNGHHIPVEALKTILQRPKLASVAKPEDVDSGRVSGLVFVSERTDSLEILHIAIIFNDNSQEPKVFNFAEVYGTFDGARLEDCPGFAGQNNKYLVYVSTKDDPGHRREPWNAVFKTNLVDGKTDRLTPQGVADFSPSVSPSGKKIAVATLQGREDGWDGEIEDLKTDIVVMDVDSPFTRKVVIRNGGWPTWGSENVLFFHRRTGENSKTFKWVVFRAEIDYTKGTSSNITRVSPETSDAMTPVALNADTVAMAIMRNRLKLDTPRDHADNYRHIEVFYLNQSQPKVVQITQKANEKADHYNPFVWKDRLGNQCIGYHRCNRKQLKAGDVSRDFNQVKSPQNDVGLFRVTGVFPTFSSDGKKLAFVDNNFKNIWLADQNGGLRVVYSAEGENGVFCPVWNQNAEKDILYFCKGKSFTAKMPVDICALIDASSGVPNFETLTQEDKYNNAFPSTNSDGTRLVFRSTRASKGNEIYKNLYIMDAEQGEFGFGKKTFKQITDGEWTDTHCQWSPKGNWIAFASNRRLITDDHRPDKREDLPDSGYFSIFLVNANKPKVQIRVIGSGNEINNVPGHVCHPFFSPDCRTIVFASDLAGVSVDPISLPLFSHSVRPYGDIFSVDVKLDEKDIYKDENVKTFHRLTHSKFENSTPCWTLFSIRKQVEEWNSILEKIDPQAPRCPYTSGNGAESWHMTGHLYLSRRCC